MIRVNRRQERGSSTGRVPACARSRTASTLAVEPLEGRQLLSIYMGPTASRPLVSGNALYQISVTGPGYETVSQLGQGHHRVIAINLYGTTSQSQLNITLQRAMPGFGKANTQLQIGKINVQSGQLGGINALGTADLLGSITPLQGAVQTIQFNSLGPNAQINVPGIVGNFQVNSANLGPSGLVHIAGGDSGTFSVGQLNLNGGKVLIDGDASGGLSLGGLNVQQGGQFIVGDDVTGASTLGTVDVDGGQVRIGQDVTALLTMSTLEVQNAGQFIVGDDLSGLQVTGSASILSNGLFQVGHNLGNMSVGQNLTLDPFGKMTIGQDVTGAISVGSGMSLSNNAQLSVGRDLLGGVTINGDLKLDSGGSISVGRDLDTVNVNGNVLFTPTAGTINVGGSLNNLRITGIYQGRNNTSTSSPELSVGSNLTNFTVLGTSANNGGVDDANIAVAKDIVGLDIAHGIFNSLITAGVLIDGSPQNSASGGNMGPDGNDAVFDSQISAGVQIKNLEINGSVASDWVTNPNPTGYRTRILAGVDRQGNWINGGNIDNFQITGALIDSVLAASVQPNGGNGTLPPGGYGANRTQSNTPGDDGFNTYDAPAGVIVGGTVAAPIPYPNYSEVSYFNETPTGVAYNTALDPTIDDNILPGSINKSFASAPLPATSLATPGTALPLPTKSTVLGGVISTSHGSNPDANDFAGIFAADTSGVFVGTLPQTTSSS